METIQALGRPTISEFAAFMRISLPNATYKVNSLVKKGYIQKKQSQEDQREYHLEVTQKYLDYYSISVTYMVEVMNRISRRFSSEECAKLEEYAEDCQQGADAGGLLSPIPELRRTFGRNGPDVRFFARISTFGSTHENGLICLLWTSAMAVPVRREVGSWNFQFTNFNFSCMINKMRHLKIALKHEKEIT